MKPAFDYADDLRRLAEMAVDPNAVTEVLRGALASLREVVPYDLAAVYELQGSTLVARVAEGPLADARIRGHRLALAEFPTIRRALETRRPIPLEEHHHRGEEGDPYDGILDLPPGHSCLAVPLFAADRSLGLITLDAMVCGMYSPAVVQLAAVYGQIVSVALLFAEQAEVLQRYRQQLREENRLLKQEVGDANWAARQLEASRSEAMQELVGLARQVAKADLPVLITGETGSGKEVLAQAIHGWSPRADAPFVKLNCAAIPEGLLESELFGHVKGAFSGAAQARRGRFATADGGTILLDEIGDMSLQAQSKLLRVLQEGTFEPVGSDETVRVDVRVIAATHIDLKEAVLDGRFREDLYYRLAGFPLTIAPLRARPDDIGPIAADVLDGIARRTGRGPWSLSREALELLVRQPWPGNVRELVNVLERATIFEPRGELEARHMLVGGSPTRRRARRAADDPGEFPTFEQMQQRYFVEALERAGGRVYGEGGAAELVALKPTTLLSRLKRLGVTPKPRVGKLTDPR